MGSGEDGLWLFKVNPKFMEVLDRLLRMMEQPPMVPHQEEKSRDENELPGGLLTVGEASQRLRISEHTLRRWINQRRLSYVKLGRRTLFNPADLDNLVKSCTIEPWKPKTR